MTFEQQLERALHTADRFEPSPDLFAKSNARSKKTRNTAVGFGGCCFGPEPP